MIYVVRHGQTNWNLENRYTGKRDIPINQTGVQQAQDLANKLRFITFDYVFCSPLKRAQQTAKIITKNPLIFDNRIMERSNGVLEGAEKSIYKSRVLFDDPTENRFGIENLVDFKNRVYSFVDDILKFYSGKNILVITHGGVSVYIREYFEKDYDTTKYASFKLPNCGYNIYKNPIQIQQEKNDIDILSPFAEFRI